MSPKSKHATVKLGDYTVPLIGIPPSATQEACQVCGKKYHRSKMTFDGHGILCCKKCLKEGS